FFFHDDGDRRGGRGRGRRRGGRRRNVLFFLFAIEEGDEQGESSYRDERLCHGTLLKWPAAVTGMLRRKSLTAGGELGPPQVRAQLSQRGRLLGRAARHELCDGITARGGRLVKPF